MWGPSCLCLKFPQIKGTIHSSSFLFVKIWPAFFFALRSVVRRAASLLSKVVDSLAPSITNVLVQGKQVSICFPHHSHSSFCLGHLVWTPWWHRRLTKRLPVAWGFLHKSLLQQERCTHSLKAQHFVGHLIFALHLGTFIFSPHVYLSSVQFPV